MKGSRRETLQNVAGAVGLVLLGALAFAVARSIWIGDATGAFRLIASHPILKPLAELTGWAWRETAWLRAESDKIVMLILFGITTLGWFVGGLMRSWSGQVFRGLAMMVLSPAIGFATAAAFGAVISLAMPVFTR